MSNQRENPFKPVKGTLKKGQLAALLVGLFLVISLLTGFYIVDQSEEAVVLRWGRYKTTTGPGLQFKAPLGIDRVYKVPVTVIHTLQFGFRTDEPGVMTIYSRGDYSNESLMLTGDLNIANVSWIIQYRINNSQDWLFNFRAADREKTIRDVSQSTINMLVGDRTIFDVMSSERTNIEVRADELIEETLSGYQMGVEIVAVKLQDVVPPEGAVQEAFEDVNKSIQDMNRLINEGKEQYNTEVPKAEGEAKRMIQEAEGYAIARENRANGDVARFRAVYEEYRRNPDIMVDRLYWETMEEVLTSDPDLEIIDRGLDNFLPLKNLTTAGGAQ
ncbi:MAG: FtsH protease activity modulator HflK [Spirochaetales bacterium]|nr:FtsH protease activity modulator HflK [Spirochaetales bacterium]